MSANQDQTPTKKPVLVFVLLIMFIIQVRQVKSKKVRQVRQGRQVRQERQERQERQVRQVIQVRQHMFIIQKSFSIIVESCQVSSCFDQLFSRYQTRLNF